MQDPGTEEENKQVISVCRQILTMFDKNRVAPHIGMTCMIRILMLLSKNMKASDVQFRNLLQDVLNDYVEIDLDDEDFK